MRMSIFRVAALAALLTLAIVAAGFAAGSRDAEARERTVVQHAPILERDP